MSGVIVKKPKVHNKHHNDIPEDVVYIGRSSRWENPFIFGRHGNRADVLAKYKDFLLSDEKLISEAKTELAGKDLVCFCAPLACHGDLLLKIANDMAD